MGIQPKSVDDLELFEAYTSRSIDDFEPEHIEEVITKIHSEYESLLSIKDSDELGIVVSKSLTDFVFSFTKDGSRIDATLKPIMDLMFGSSDEVEEPEPNKFIVTSQRFNKHEELEQWVKDNTPFNNITIDTTTPTPQKSNTVTINGTNVTLTGLTDDEIQQRRWARFESKFDEQRRVLVTVRNTKFNSKVGMKLMSMFGSFDEGLWDTFNMDGNTTVQTLLDEREENNDPNPVTYIIGFSEKVPLDQVEKFQKFVNRMKLTARS